MSRPVILIMAGGTGGHIMPGLAVAHELQRRGWAVHWLGHPERMEGKLVPAQGLTLHPLRFSGLRGKGLLALAKLPFTLGSACLQANKAIRRLGPDVVLGMGGYVAFPGGLVAALRRIPLIVHEQNAIGGTANRWLAKFATKVIAGFPGALPGAVVVGNPVRQSLTVLPPVGWRYRERTGALRVLVIGGSLGAHALNAVIPQALARIAAHLRPQVWHQSGEQHLQSLRASYQQLDVEADCIAFIDNMAEALGWADLVICRAGAMTVSEVAVAGVAALFVPLPHAIDDHQSANARYLTECHGAWQCRQADFTPDWLAGWLSSQTREALAEVASHAQQHARPEASSQIADACVQAVRRPA